MRTGQNTGCPLCSKRISKAETELYDFIRSILAEDNKVETQNSKIVKPYFLDIYIPSLKIAFEFNGIYWHSEEMIQKAHGMSSKKYHSTKRDLASRKGITLYFVWEDDWGNKKEEVKTLIKAILEGVAQNTKILERVNSY